jgi:hypothetical protein
MEHAFEWPRTEVIERGKYLLDRRVFWRNGARDLIALTAALLLGMSLFEIMLISVIDALFRVFQSTIRIRLARGRARGRISPMFISRDGRSEVDHSDPKELSRAFLVFSLFVVLLSAVCILAGIHTERGTGGIEPLRVAMFSAIYTLPFFFYEQWRWMREQRDQAVPHILSRDLSSIVLLAAVFAMVLWGDIAGVLAFVLLRALNDSAELVPSYSLDGVNWTTTWNDAWDPVADDTAQPVP